MTGGPAGARAGTAMHDCTLQVGALAAQCMAAPEAEPYRGPWCRIG